MILGITGFPSVIWVNEKSDHIESPLDNVVYFVKQTGSYTNLFIKFRYLNLCKAGCEKLYSSVSYTMLPLKYMDNDIWIKSLSLGKFK